MILYINACNHDDSRTARLARRLIARLTEAEYGTKEITEYGNESNAINETEAIAEYETEAITEYGTEASTEYETQVKEVRLYDMDFPAADETFISRRETCIAAGDYSDPMFDTVHDFARAEAIVIAAPYWDLSFPAVLKTYLEQMCVRGLTFAYSEEGIPYGLCSATNLYYVTTAGAEIFNEEFGYGYVRALAQLYFGIPETAIIKAEWLDIDGADVVGILKEAEAKIDTMTLRAIDDSPQR